MKRLLLLMLVLLVLACGSTQQRTLSLYPTKTPQTPNVTVIVITTTNPSPTATTILPILATPTVPIVVVAEQALNLRETPGGRILVSMLSGEVLTFKNECSETEDGVMWAKVFYKGLTGWARESYLDRRVCE